MTRINKLKIALSLMLLGLVCCYIFQLFYTNKVKESLESSAQLQELLNVSDEASSNLGSIQQFFRTYTLNPSDSNLQSLKSYQHRFETVLNKQILLSLPHPKIKSHLDTIYNLYHKEFEITYSLPANLNLTNSSIIIEQSERRVNLIWNQVWTVRAIIKTLLKQNNEDAYNHLDKKQGIRIVSLLSAIGLIVLVFVFYSSVRKFSYKASSSSKSLFTNQLLLMKSLLDTTTTLMYIIDANGKFLFANESFLIFFGLKESEVLGKIFLDLDLDKDFSFESNSVITNSTIVSLEQEEVVYSKGNKLYFFTRKFPIKNSKNEVFASGVVCRNITERIINEEGLKKSRRDAEQAKLTQEQFMANISHEIRTPMNGIIGMTNLLANTSLTEEQKDFLQTIRQSSDNLMGLINDILDFSKIEAGKLELENISFKITDVLDQIITPLKIRVREKNLILNVKIDHKVPSKILGDPLRLNQILTNILSNAIKFTSQGNINLIVSAVSYNAPLVKIIFKIEDTGIGIPSDRINYIFQSFTQTSLDITRKFGGTGLGLAIVKQLVDLHNGHISVQSEENKGSTFTIEIPYKPIVDSKRSLDENLKFELLKGKRVLVVEDNFINQKVIMQTLKNASIETSLADNGFTALDLLKSESFDLVIMDIQMPDIDGCETTVRIRKELKLDIPVIAMTASAMQEDRDKCRAAGMNEFISKPFVTEDLLEKMLLFID